MIIQDSNQYAKTYTITTQTTSNASNFDVSIANEAEEYLKPFRLIGINLNGDYSSFSFADMLESKMQKTKLPSETELQSAKTFLKNQMKEMMESLYKENLEFIHKAITAEKNIFAQKGSKEDFELLKNQGGDKILNILKTFPVESCWAKDELQNGISKEDIEQIRIGLQHYIQSELASVGTEFFAFALNFEKLQLAEHTREQIMESLSLVHSYYHKSTSLNFEGTTIHYESGEIGQNALMGFLIVKINEIEKITHSTNIIASMQEIHQQTLFDIMENKEKLESKASMNHADSIMQTLLKESKESRGV